MHKWLTNIYLTDNHLSVLVIKPRMFRPYMAGLLVRECMKLEIPEYADVCYQHGTVTNAFSLTTSIPA